MGVGEVVLVHEAQVQGAVERHQAQETGQNEADVVDVVEVALSGIARQTHVSTLPQRDAGNQLAIDVGEVDLRVVVMLVHENAFMAVGVVNDAEVNEESLERQAEILRIAGNRRVVLENLVQHRRGDEVGLRDALPVFQSAVGDERIGGHHCFALRHSATALQQSAVTFNGANGGIALDGLEQVVKLAGIAQMIAQSLVLLRNGNRHGIAGNIRVSVADGLVDLGAMTLFWTELLAALVILAAITSFGQWHEYHSLSRICRCVRKVWSHKK